MGYASEWLNVRPIRGVVSLDGLRPRLGAFAEFVGREINQISAGLRFGQYMVESPFDKRCRPEGYIPLNQRRLRGERGWRAKAWRPRRRSHV